MGIPKHRQKRSRTSQTMVIQLLLIHALYYGTAVGAIKVKSLLFEVVPNTVYRSGQPSMDQLSEWIDRYKFKTIINLRGTNYPMYEEEKAVGDAHGITMEYIDISAYRLIRHDRLIEIIQTLESAEKPILLHCNHGVDRSGTVSALAAWLIGKEPFEQAKRWSYVPPGPWKYREKISPYHVSETLDVYQEYCGQNQLDPNHRDNFMHWAQHVYDHVETNHQQDGSQ